MRGQGIQFQTMYQAQLKVKYDEGVRNYKTVEEVMQDMAKRGLPVESVRAPERLMEQLWQLTEQENIRRAGGQSSQSRNITTYEEKMQM